MSTIGELEVLNENDEGASRDNHAQKSGRRELPSSLNPFKTSAFPILVIDRKLNIVYSNEACARMFAGFPDFSGKYFIDIFTNAFSRDDLRKIRDTIINGTNSFTWKGSAQIKSQGAISSQMRVYIFPLELNKLKSPNDFVVMFDDFTDENKILLRSIFLSLLEASRLKDNDSGMHITRVNEYSKLLSEELQKTLLFKRIDADFIENISFLAGMHDIGKIGTPDDILNKDGPLSDWEWTVMREHTKNGAFILSTYPNPMAKEIALSHHEKWNGRGYPFQLEGEMIPLAARIVVIADVYDALRTERSYKPSLSHEVAAQKIIDASGSHFDPRIIKVFMTITNEFERIYNENPD